MRSTDGSATPSHGDGSRSCTAGTARGCSGRGRGWENPVPPEGGEDAKAANAEIGLLLGLTGRLLSGPLAARLPALRPAALAVLGPRDDDWRRRFNVGSVGGV